jgi:hypothetical protein
MKKWYWPALVLLLIGWRMDAANSVTAADGTTYLFGDWSAPKSLVVKSSDGESDLVLRTCEVTRQDPDSVWPETFAVELVFDPSTGEVCLGELPRQEPPRQYVKLGQKIWGLRAQKWDRLLLIYRSENAGEAANGGELLIDKYLNKLLQDPQASLSPRGNGRGLDTKLIFGADAVVTSERSLTQLTTMIELSSLAVDDKGVIVALKSHAGRTLSLSLGVNLEIVAASIDGKPALVLSDGLVPRRELPFWTFATGAMVPSAKGAMRTLNRVLNYYVKDDSGNERMIDTIHAAVLEGTGDLWIGPASCHLAVVEGRMLGAMANKAGELLLFTERGVLPLSPPETSRAFSRELTQFENDFKTNQYEFKPDSKVGVPMLFAGDARLPAGSWFRVTSVSVRDKSLIITCSSSKPGAYPQIEVGSDLRVLSTGVLSLEELRQSERLNRPSPQPLSGRN